MSANTNASTPATATASAAAAAADTAAAAPPDNTNCLDRCSLNCGSCLFGIAVKIHYTFFVLVILEVVLGQLRYSAFPYTILLFLLYGPILVITILIHEFGHCLMNRFFGGHVDHILIWPLGGFAIIGPTSGNVMQDFWVAFAGPLTHVPQIAFWVLIYAIFSGFAFSNFNFDISLHPGSVKSFITILAEQAIELNIFLVIFNLFVPAYPLDGGRCLAALLVRCGTDVTHAAKITAITAIVIACGMIAYAVYNIAFQGQGPGLLTIIIAFFILSSSSKLLRMAREDKAREHPLFNRPCYLHTANHTANARGSSTTTTNANDGNVELGKTDNEPVEEKAWYHES